MPCLTAPVAQLDSHVGGGSSSSDISMAYTAEDWQAQLEEVLALHAIYAENFRCVRVCAGQVCMEASLLAFLGLHGVC